MKKILVLLSLMLSLPVYADPNVYLTASHQESYVSKTSSLFALASSVATSVLVKTTSYEHRSFAVLNTTNQDMVLVIVAPGASLSSSSVAPLYIPAGWTRIVDNASDQLILPGGSKIYAYAPGSAPSSGALILDQLF